MKKTLSALLFALAAAREAQAAPPPPQPPNPAAYAVVIGSNAGGQGQDPLAFAESDARRVKDVLTELGRYAPANIRLLSHPSPSDVLATLDELKGRLEAHRQRGEEATVFFYYSGHARANAMNLGETPLELRELRSKLTSLPTALTIVVLDACQSGAFSRVKGAERAADFSFNSVQSLNTHGLAVMASSTSTELSQESDRLGSSYFTNYLVAALRGAGDQNKDGRVSLDEAYKFAYGQTLAATSRTAVGGQHVTLETELTGQGDVAMSYPASSTSHLVLPAEFEGQVLVQNKPQRAVLAELTKAPGTWVQLALPPSQYEAIVRKGGKAWECPLTLGDYQMATLSLASCSPIADEPAQSKGESNRTPEEAWGIDLGLGLGFAGKNDGYVNQLRDFGYEKKTLLFSPDIPLVWSLGVSRQIATSAGRRLSVAGIARIRNLDSRSFDRGFLVSDDKQFDWATYGLSLGARVRYGFVPDMVDVYGQVELGPALGRTSYHDGNASPEVNESETFIGYQVGAAIGLQIMPFRKVGIFTEAAYAYAPVISNLLGDTHDSGGISYLVGLRIRTWSGQ